MATQSNQAMVSETSICNQALTWLGQDPINSINDDNTTAAWMRNNYTFIRDAVLEERTWTFATARATSITEDRDEWDQMWKHPKPLNWLSVFRVFKTVYTNGGDIIDQSWRMEGPFILSRNATVYMWGLIQITDTGKFSPLFVQALAARIAADAAVPLTNNRQLQVDLWGLYGDKLREAAARDGQQGANDRISQTRLTSIRYSSGGE